MPGGRLSHDERRQIAALLAHGLGYAEIARRLGRPTSTVSREVARNGEPGAYRADSAQHVAAGRAQRRKAPPASPPTDAADAMDGFAAQLAALLAATGLPRMAARVFACLLTCEPGSLSAGELVSRLRVSPASVSKAVGYLHAMDLLVRRPDPGGRRERYAIADDVWQRAWRTDTGAHAELAATAARGARLYGTQTPAGARLHRTAEFFAWLSGQMGEGGPGQAVVADALTVVAALSYATTPLTVQALATALDWEPGRAGEALAAVRRRPELADPLALVFAEPDTYTIVVRTDRLSAAQREALDAPARGAGDGRHPS